MRRLAQPAVVKSAGLAAALTAIVCYPRCAWWDRPYVTWYLEAVLFTGSFVLWAFVFAWHTVYTGRPVLPSRIQRKWWVLATAAGLVVAGVLHWWLDPIFKARTPADYPNTWGQWLAMTLFTVSFNPLVLTFAPLAWAVRLSRRLWVAVGFTILFGVLVTVLKMRSAPTPVPPLVFVELLALRLVLGSGAVFFYLQGGAGLVWWGALLLQLRHLIDLLT